MKIKTRCSKHPPHQQEGDAMTHQQALLPFNEYTGQHLTVHLRGPRTMPQFVATGGLLHAYHPHSNEPMPVHEYHDPPENLWDDEGSPPTPGVSFEEEVAAYVEYTAQVLYELVQDIAELERVAQRFRQRARPASNRLRAAKELQDEQASVNTYFGEVLENYCLQLGANAAESLAQWVAATAEQLDEPAPGSRAKAQLRGPRGFYDAVPA